MLATARRLGELGIDGVKIHLFHILRGSEMEKLYAQGKVAVMDQNKYIETVCDFLENLPADMIIQRLTGEGPRSMHIAPAWALDKTRVINSICQALENRGSRQGIRYGRNP
jgi:radical SAM superfamily enzyme